MVGRSAGFGLEKRGRENAATLHGPDTFSATFV